MSCCLNANAITVEQSYDESFVISPQASGQFSLTVKANSFSKSSSSLSLASGETVTISASYTPKTKSIDVGLMDEEGTFYYVTATKGTIDATIKVENRGNYKLTIRNNSSSAIDVSGIITY